LILRYAIWAAVSTKVQAGSDRVSIPEQIERCRNEGQAREWNETSGPFVVSGNSRTKYVNIFTVEWDMPALREMLDAAQAREFDVILIYDLNRFRDLLDPIYRTLGGYRIQLYSLSQPVEPCEPAKYKWYRSDTMRIVVMMS
jgi:DNA invertase Pin-like site-specific DNA recombinase